MKLNKFAKKLKKILKENNEKVVLHFHNQYNMFFFLKLTSKKLREKATLAYTNKAEDADIEYLYEKYDTLLGNSLATAIYGTYSLSTFNAKSDADKELNLERNL